MEDEDKVQREVEAHHSKLYSDIESKYKYDELEDQFIIGTTETQVVVIVYYDYDNNRFVLCVDVCEVCYFTLSREFNQLVALLIKT